MVARVGGALLLVLLCSRGVPAIDSPSSDPVRPPIPPLTGGVEIEEIRGWFANIYPWKYLPSLSTVYPVSRLWGRPNDYQSPADIARQNALLDEYGSGADVLEYSANPDAPDHNQWLRTYFSNGHRPFFVAYEHVFGTRLIPDNGAKNMNVKYNRIAFKNDIDAIKQEFGSAYDPLGPFVVFSELIEGAAVIESQCISDTLDKRDRWVGCGTGRLEILKEYFGN